MEHTELPWKVNKEYADGGGKYIAIHNDKYDYVIDQYGIYNQTDAAFIVKSCNNHYKMLDILKKTNDLFSSRFEDGYKLMANSPECGKWIDSLREAIKQASFAGTEPLAQAEEG